MGELFAHPRMYDVPMRRIAITPSEYERFQLREGDLLFARRSLVADGAGKCAIVLEVNEPTVFESSIIRARPDPARANSLYLYYYFNSPSGLHRLDTIRRHVAVAGITGGDLSKLNVEMPSITEQARVAETLASLDTKIELNLRMNETLETVARAIFRDWFVDFGPIRAKIAGATPYLSADLWAMFPDQLDEDGKPEGWCETRLGKIVANVVQRCTPGQWTVERPYVPIDCITARSAILQQWRPGADAASSLVGFAKGDILFGAMRPYFYKVCLAPFEGSTRTTVWVLRPNAAHDLMFAFSTLDQQSTVDFATSHSTGSTIPYAVWSGTMSEMPVILPSSDIRLAYARIVQPFYDRALANAEENHSLAQTRDLLLPELISGKARLRDSERALEAVER